MTQRMIRIRHVRSGPNSEVELADADFRFTPKADTRWADWDVRKAKPGHENGPKGRKKSRLAAASQIQICKSIGPL